MTNNKASKTYPFTIRLTAEQRNLLEHRAGKLSLGEYIRLKALNDNEITPKFRNIQPIKNQKVAYQLLGELGRSKIADNLHPIVEAAKIGTLVISEEELAVLISACADIAEMRKSLMQALGHRSAANDN